MKKEDKAVRMFMTQELHDALEARSGKQSVSDYIKAELYKSTGVKQPLPPTAEQKRIMTRIASMESMVKDGLLEQSMLDTAKKNAAEKYDIDFGVVDTADDVSTDTSADKEPAKAESAKDVSGIPKPSTQTPAQKPTTSQQKPAQTVKK